MPTKLPYNQSSKQLIYNYFMIVPKKYKELINNISC
jgi:hypothetical protein